VVTIFSGMCVFCVQDEGIRLRKIVTATTSESSHAQRPTAMTSARASLDVSPFASQPPIAYLIAMLILGVIIGKFLL